MEKMNYQLTIELNPYLAVVEKVIFEVGRTTINDFAQQYDIKSLPQIISGLKKNPERRIHPRIMALIEDALNIKFDYSDPQNITYQKLFSKKGGHEESYIIGQNKYPILTQVHGGYILELKESAEGYAYFPYHKTENCYVLRIKEDSLSGIVKPGDLILIDKDAAINNGDIVIVKFISGKQVIKRYRKITDEIIQLYTGVPGYEPEEYKFNDIEIIQKVVGKWETF
jgi:repressor LexA